LLGSLVVGLSGCRVVELSGCIQQKPDNQATG
jgi:hypothetical protein